jgi:hypothetical protein
MEQLLKDFALAISPALQVLLEALFTLLATQAAAYIYGKIKQQRAQMSDQERYLADFIVGQAARAAEQLYKDGKGAEKKAYALAAAEKALAKYGVTLDLDIVEAKLEAAVYDQFKHYPELDLPRG